MLKSQSLFNLIIAVHDSGVTITRIQEHKTTVTTASGNRYTVLLSAAIVENLELIWVFNVFGSVHLCTVQYSDKLMQLLIVFYFISNCSLYMFRATGAYHQEFSLL
jgi:hypothetical protein